MNSALWSVVEMSTTTKREETIHFAHGNASNASKKLHFQARVKFTNKLPESINSTLNKNIFETPLKSLLVSFYSLMSLCWAVGRIENRTCCKINITAARHVSGWVIQWMCGNVFILNENKIMWYGCVRWLLWHNVMYCFFTINYL